MNRSVCRTPTHGRKKMKAVSKFSHMTIDGIGYFEPEEAMTYDEAIKWAGIRGLRLLTRGEWCDLYDHKEEFRKSCQDTYYWTASVCSSNQSVAWYFSGGYGSVYDGNRRYSYAVRAVLAEPEGQQNY
jgi:hypothetical protein